MSVDNTTVIDAIGVERSSGKVILTIADHLDWHDELGHLFALQEKINAYLRFIESGEIDGTYPDAVGRDRVIDVVAKHALTQRAQEFFRKTVDQLANVGIELRTQVLDG